jgi:hypothetical protein
MVARTMAILLKLGKGEMARELDRAFFTTLPPVQVDVEGGEREVGELNKLGRGLGIDRGGVRTAWMQSLALRLDRTVYQGLEEFTELFGELQDAPSGTVDPTFVAFLERQANILASRTKREKVVGEGQDEGRRAQGSGRRPRMRESKFFGDAGVVRKAIIETELLFHEGGNQRSVHDARYLQLQGSVHELLEDLDTPATELGHDDTVNRSQTLHIAIRFLLIRAQLSATIYDLQEQQVMYQHSMDAVYKLYDSLLALLPLVADSPLDLQRVKERQTAALYRVLSASIGGYDASQHFEARALPVSEMDLRAEEESTPPVDFHLVSSAWTSIDSSLLTLSLLPPIPSPPPCPVLMGISTSFWRRALYALTLPSSPTRRASSTQSIRAPWPLLKRTLELILACKTHDSPPLPRYPPDPRTSRDIHLHPIFIRRSLTIHLVRATLLGGPSSPSSSEGEETVHSRLAYLLQFFDGLNEEGRGERVKRTVVRTAVEEIVSQEFGGEVWRVWGREMRGFVARWQEGGDGLVSLQTSSLSSCR